MIYQVRKKVTPFFAFSTLATSVAVASAEEDKTESKEVNQIEQTKLEKVRLDERIKNSDTSKEETSLKVQKLNLVLQQSKTKLKLVEIKKEEPKKVNTKNVTVQNASLPTKPTISQVSNAGNLYAPGWCTWGVKQVAPWVGNNWGNAYQWAASAASQGFDVGSVPKVGSVVVWSGNHVAYVTDVREDGYIQVLEANYNGNRYIANHRGYFNPNGIQGSVSYIYPKA